MTMIETNTHNQFHRSGIAILVAFMVLVSLPASASEGGSLLHGAGNDVADIASLQRGARNFVNYCMGCHAAKYIRFNKLQTDLRLSDEQMRQNLMFSAKTTDELMEIAMPPADAERWFGQTPPDLTLIARSRGVDWVYSFLKSFYLDEYAATGMNNLLLPNASMPHVLWELQGLQEATFRAEEKDGTLIEHFGEPYYFEEFEMVRQGEMSAEEYDQFVRDLVNFLDWAGSPEQLERQRLGIWVIAFLFVFLIFAYLLKVEIWKDIK